MTASVIALRRRFFVQGVDEAPSHGLLVEGGSELNASLLSQDLVDELFWTVSPKVKLGRDVPTYADGESLPREALLNFRLLGNETVGDEVYLRYHRRR